MKSFYMVMRSTTCKLLISSLLVIPVLLVSGCAGHPEGLKKPRELTDIEKDRVVEIGLNTPEALRQLDTEKVALAHQYPAKKGPRPPK